MDLENLGYTYNVWEEVYCKVMSSGLSIGYISDCGSWHYYLETEGLVIRDETMAKLNADFKELKDDFDNFMKWLKTNNK